jgi:DNA-binding response OmpR family regulator/nitrogen-specific signal transduction histidine kinase
LVFVKSVKRNANLQRRLYFERTERQKEVEVAQIKQDFFTNVTHEFRTPLTLIIGPLENLIAKYRDDRFLGGQLEVIYRNSNRLLRLINELLEVRKIEEKGIELKLSKEDFLGFVGRILDGFSIALQNRNIDFDLATNIERLDVCFDKEKLEKVIFNLLSNALKHTPECGRIRCEVNDVGNGFVSFKVIDSGPGIDPEILPKIFDKFFTKGQVSGYSGLGIGLHLAKRLVLLHNGIITAQNNSNAGACFEVLIPIENENFSGDSSVAEVETYDYKALFGKIVPEEAPTADESAERSAVSVLIVEDNDDVRSYVGSILTGLYDIKYAVNGEEGLKIAFETIPDLIITDVMMPKLDGKSLCHAIKTDVRTSHIPIIMMTALADIDSRIQGLDVGADSYLVKPFHPKHMLVRIKQLLNLRKVLQAKYGGEVVKNVQSFEYTAQEVGKLSVDEVFINRLVAFIEKNLSNAELEVEDICKEMGMNYLQLYRKVKAITDMSIKQFVLTIRMRNAAKLLESGKFTISEVAFDVGFSSPAYFSKIFRRFFDKTATEYLQDKENEDSASEEH